MKIKLFGTEIYISFLFAGVITIMLATDRTGLVLPSLFAIVMHEVAHLFAMWALDCAPKRIRLIPASVQITSSFSKKYRNDIIIALCGPAVNFLLFAVLWFNYKAYSNQAVIYLSLVNLAIGMFNALPVYGLDGGTVLFSILSKIYNPNKASVILKAVTFFVALCFFISAIFLTLNGKLNISFYIMAIYLFIGVIIKM